MATSPRQFYEDPQVTVASAWAMVTADDARRGSMAVAAGERAERLRWSAAVQSFTSVIDEAVARAKTGS